MKTLATSFLTFVIASLMSVTSMAQTVITQIDSHQASTNSEVTVAQGFLESARVSQIFLPDFKGLSPLANVPETLSYFQDTTNNSVNVPFDFDSTGPIKLGYPDGTTKDTIVTLYYKGIGQRFTTNLKTAYLDSVSLTFIPHTFGANDHLVFMVRPMHSVPATAGGTLPLIDFFNQYTPYRITKDVVYNKPLTLDAYNTISVSFGHLPLATKNHNFAITAVPVGPGIATDTFLYTMDANLSDYQATWAIDTDASRSYLVRTDSALTIAGNNPIGDLRQYQGGQPTNMAYFGNFIMVAYLSGVSAGVSNQEVTSQNRLSPNYPNPVNGVTHFNYNLGSSGVMSLRIFNSVGEQIATVVNGFQSAGGHSMNFDASKLANGVYACRMQAGDFSQTTTMIVNK